MSKRHFKPGHRGPKWYAEQDAIDFPHAIKRKAEVEDAGAGASAAALASDKACAGSGSRIVSGDLTAGEPVYTAICAFCEEERNAYRDDDGWYIGEHASGGES